MKLKYSYTELFAIILIILITVGIVFFFIPKEYKHSQQAIQLADSGCVSLGHPRDLNTVYFYDCNGEIRMKRIK